MGVWAATASLYDLWMMYGCQSTCSSCYRNVYICQFISEFLGGPRFFNEVCSTLWEDLGGRDDELGKQVAHVQSNEAWTEMPSMSHESVGLLPYCPSAQEDGNDAIGTRHFWLLFFLHHKCIRKMTSPLTSVWILNQVCTLWRASRQSWENLPTSKASKKWCQQRPDIQFTGIRKTKNPYSIMMKLTWIGMAWWSHFYNLLYFHNLSY